VLICGFHSAPKVSFSFLIQNPIFRNRFGNTAFLFRDSRCQTGPVRRTAPQLFFDGRVELLFRLVEIASASCGGFGKSEE
jgi:hypothetical protein